MNTAKEQAARVLDHLRKHIGPELMVTNNHTQERYERLIGDIQAMGNFTAKEAADIMIKYLDAQWENLKA